MSPMRRFENRKQKRPRPISHYQSLHPTLPTGNYSDSHGTTQTYSTGTTFRFPLLDQDYRNGVNQQPQSPDRFRIQSNHQYNNSGFRARSPRNSYSRFDSRNYTVGPSSIVRLNCNPIRPLPTANHTEAKPSTSRNSDYLNGDSKEWNCFGKSLQIQETEVYRRYSELRTEDKHNETHRRSNYKTELHVEERTVFRQQQIYYESRPQDHPRYAAEWQSFCERHMELKSQGKSFSNHELKLDWFAFWERRLKEMNETRSSYQHSQQLNAIELHSLSFYNQHLDPRRNRIDQRKHALQPRTLFSDQLQDPILIPIIPQQ